MGNGSLKYTGWGKGFLRISINCGALALELEKNCGALALDLEKIENLN